MARKHSALSLSILTYLDLKEHSMLHEIYKAHTQAKSQKIVYDAVYRLKDAGLITVAKNGYTLTPEGVGVIHKFFPKKDGIWKIVIFDIPEKQRAIRSIFRAKLEALHFKRWQNSIWISPYELDKDIEEEFGLLAKKFFIRLIKTTDINRTDDLKKLFDK